MFFLGIIVQEQGPKCKKNFSITMGYTHVLNLS